jgi:hypothetical protein
VSVRRIEHDFVVDATAINGLARTRHGTSSSGATIPSTQNSLMNLARHVRRSLLRPYASDMPPWVQLRKQPNLLSVVLAL